MLEQTEESFFHPLVCVREEEKLMQGRFWRERERYGKGETCTENSGAMQDEMAKDE